MIVNGSIQSAGLTTAQIAASTAIPLVREIVYNTDTGKYAIGDGVTALNSLTFYGGISASGITTGTTTITSGTNTRVLYNNNGVVGEYSVTGTGNAVLSDSPQFTTLVNIGNKTTASQRIVRIGQDTGWVDIGSLIGSTSLGAIYINQATPSGSNYCFSSTGSNLLINSTDAISFRISDSNRYTITSAGQLNTWNPATGAIGALTAYTFNSPANTNQTLSTNIPNFKVTGSTKQWATGALATQYFNYFSANTVSFVGASTATNVYNLFVDSPVQGTNATITNAYSFGTQGKAKFGGNVELTQTVTTEALTSDTSVTIVINGTTYKLLAKA